MKKEHMYKTAYWDARSEFVKLVKYHSYGNFYDIETISGECFSVHADEMSRFVL